MNPLRYYHDSWWKVASEPIWLLAGKDTESERNLKIGWYFSDETGDFHGPFDQRKECEDALNNYSRIL